VGLRASRAYASVGGESINIKQRAYVIQVLNQQGRTFVLKTCDVVSVSLFVEGAREIIGELRRTPVEATELLGVK